MITIDFKALDLKDGHRVLDLGCGRGRHMHGLYWHELGLDCVGLDLSWQDCKAALDGFFDLPPPEGDAPRSANFTAGDAAHLPFPDQSFDRIICSEVLEHIPDVEAALSEINRILKPGGRLAISVPRWWPEKLCWMLSEEYPNTPGGHVRIFHTGALKQQVKNQGLTYYKKHGGHALHSPYWWLQCALWKRKDTSDLVALYRKFLEWDIIKGPRLTRWMEAALNPLMAKSVALYFTKPQAGEQI